MKISDALKGVRRLGVDTSPYIYYVENHRSYADKMDAILQIVEANGLDINTSVIALTETLMKPLQATNQSLINAYRDLLIKTDYIHLIAVTSDLAEKAATLRVQYNLRTPDALHIATAIVSHCEAFLTNDLGLKRVMEIRILVLDELEIDPNL